MPLPVVMLSVAVYSGSWTLNVCHVSVVIVLEPCSQYIAHKASDFTCCCVSITARKPLRSRTSPRYLQGNMLIRATRVGYLRFRMISDNQQYTLAQTHTRCLQVSSDRCSDRWFDDTFVDSFIPLRQPVDTDMSPQNLSIDPQLSSLKT